MEKNNLKYVVGQAKSDAPAIIRFFGSVDSSSTNCFNEEFLWLQDCVKPSKIIVLINSDGGSVIHGMSTFSIIQSCPIEVDCIIEGIAASMGSVIWAAGDHLYMHDYSILMIHNPFLYSDSCEDETIKNMLQAFRTQIETIYVKRFGLAKDKVRAIMDGEGEADGTYFNAKDAVDAGILPADHIVKTSKQLHDKVKSQIDGVNEVAALRDIMASIANEVNENELPLKVGTIHGKGEEVLNTTTNQTNTMEKQVNFEAVAAQLGFKAEAAVADVAARITALLKAEGELKDVKSQLDKLKVEFAGKEAAVTNLQTELTTVKASLKEYQDAEKAQKDAAIAKLIQDAIDAGKIDEKAKDSWIQMANANLETVKATLDSIPARQVISEEIKNDPQNQAHADEALKTAQEKMVEKVKSVVGDVKLLTF